MNSRRDFLRSAVLSVAVVTGMRPVSAGPVRVVRPAGPPKPPFLHAPMGVANGCFVETVALLDAWRDAKGTEAWSRLLQWGARDDDEIIAGHAVAIVDEGGALWCWDLNFGWSRLPGEVAQRDEAALVAAPVLKKYPRVTAQFPLYRHDFPQTPGQLVSAALAVEPNAAVRDARIVGARLAMARPVNVVRFAYAEGERRRESAAAVFVFHGRYCVYVPELGTVPFRARGGVENVRLIQDLLRRALPGVTGVRKA
ncbi:MAG: hypothetical protein Q8N18_14240 [Opitutaceae bacterium]|nr:hypothetical protein [Opitutaceae bacterium]